jgi:hypothetical protein
MSVCTFILYVCVYVATWRGADPPFKESYRLCKKDNETKEEAGV